jgi:transcription elongation factor
MKGSEGKGGHMPPRCWSKGKRRFIKRGRQSRSRGSRQERSHGGAGSRTSHHLTCNQTPAYIRGSGPLDKEDPIFFFLL